MKKLITAMIVGGCITVFSAGAAFAETPAADPNTSVSQEVEVNEAILKKQQEVDKYLFEDHAADVEKQGITVTHTAPLSDHVEIGITPYDEAKAEYLYGIFGREQVKVVEGEQAVTFGGPANAEAGGAQEQMTTTAAAPAADPNTSVSHEVDVNEAMLKKQQEVDKYLFEDHAADVEKQGITVTHTAPLSDHVEIGITPYDDAKAEYLYGIFGREQVKVVEGEQAVTFGGSANAEAGGAQEQMTTTAAAPAAETATAGETSVWNTVLYVTGGLLLALAAVLAVRKFRAKRN